MQVLHSDYNIVAVVVTFRPSAEELSSLVKALGGQVDEILIVDNTPSGEKGARHLLNEALIEKVSIIPLGKNEGLGAALNVGIKKAIAHDATHVLLCDQDSEPQKYMVFGLLCAIESEKTKGKNIAAAGPVYVEKYTAKSYPFQVNIPGHFFYGHVLPAASAPIVETTTLITSGTLISVGSLKEIGLMREDFFIDHIDTEWCHRARACGYLLLGVGNSHMAHTLGEGALKFWFFGWRSMSAYPPKRIYFRVRNFVVLCFERGISIRWKVRSSIYWLGFVYAHVFFSDKKRQSLYMAIKGFVDGLRGHLGAG